MGVLASTERAIVTGASGFVGRHLVRRLVAQGIPVLCIGRSMRSNFAETGSDVARTCWSDDSLRSTLRAWRNACIFHLAAAGVIPGRETPETVVTENVGLMARLMGLVSESEPRLVISVGSCSEYGPCSEPRVPETTPLLPNSVYGASKAAAFLCGRSMADRLRIPFVHLRPFGIIGPGESPSRLIPWLSSRLRAGEAVPLTGGEQVRDFLFVDDVVEAIWVASRLPLESAFREFNICSGLPTRVREIGSLVASMLAAPSELLRWGDLPYRPDEPMYLVGDPSRFQAVTGWRPRVSLQDGLAKMFALDASGHTK